MPSLPLALALLGAAPLALQTEVARPEAWERDPVLLRSRALEIPRSSLEPGAAQSLELVLFDGRRVRAELVSAERTDSGGHTWYGRLPADPLGSASFALHGSAVVGSVRANGALYRVRETRAGSLVLYECDQRAFPTCEAEAVAPLALATEGSLPSETRNVSGTAAALTPQIRPPAHPGSPLVDALVAWTQEAEDAAGGVDAIQAVIDLAVLDTNIAFQNSQVNLTLRLAHASRIDYVESGSQATDLARLQNPADGVMDDIHLWRQAYGADVVSLFIANAQRCGRSYNMGAPPSHAFRAYAFNLVAQSCATGYYAYAHELGHGFGLDHDRANTSNIPSRPYAYGHWTANGLYRTIMALERFGVFGTRLQYFSNPKLKYENQELGVANSSPASANCAQALNENAPIFTAWEPVSSAIGFVKPNCTIGELVLADAEVALGTNIHAVLADPDEDVPADSLPVVVLSALPAVPVCGGFPMLDDMLVSFVLYRVAPLWRPNSTYVVEVPVPNIPTLAGRTLNVQPLYFTGPGQVVAGNSATATVLP